jgi:hypothetical protein
MTLYLPALFVSFISAAWAVVLFLVDQPRHHRRGSRRTA